MFKKIFVEKSVKESAYTQHIIRKINNTNITYIECIDDIWGRVKKPYLQKRDNLNLFIGEKKGSLVKEAPSAYGIGSEKHYYFVHAFNCIYECQYCYLQGYFNTPDIVLYVNHDEIIKQMQDYIDLNNDCWFHAGEYSDSLALSHITGEWENYWKLFKKNKKAKLELRTKSVNIKAIQDLEPLDNIYISFSLTGKEEGKLYDNKTPSVKARLVAIEKLVSKGFMIGIHLDPVIYTENIFESYTQIIQDITKIIPEYQLGYISIGVVRFTKSVYTEVSQNYPDSKILAQNFTKSFDNKVRYNHPMRMWILNSIKQICIDHQIDEKKIYLCMEDNF